MLVVVIAIAEVCHVQHLLKCAMYSRNAPEPLQKPVVDLAYRSLKLGLRSRIVPGLAYEVRPPAGRQ